MFQIENSLVLAQAPNLNIPAAASYLDSEALLPFAKLKQVRNLVCIPNNVKNIGISVEGCMFLRKGVCFYSTEIDVMIAPPCSQGFWTKGLDKIITSLNGVSDAKYYQRTLRSVLVLKPELFG